METPAKPGHSAAAPVDAHAVWNEETLADPHHDTAKAERVHAMFNHIAPSYDLNNRLHSLWMDQSWRRKAVRLAELRPGVDRVVDVACGTGDLALAFAKAGAKEVRGIDFAPVMIEHATRKAAGAEAQVKPRFEVGDAMALAVEDGAADIVSIAFGIRNVADPRKALKEFRRILRPGGRLVILEFSEPRQSILRWLYNFYFRRIMPRTATWISGDRTGAYRYLPRSVETFITPEAMRRMMEEAGFINVSVRALTMGICNAYLGRIEN